MTIPSMDTLIRDVDYVVTPDGVLTAQDILIADGRIAAIGTTGTELSAPVHPRGGLQVVSGRGKIAMPSMKNAHTHAAMTLLRGYGDDMLLQPWLETRIWPAEAKLTAEDVYWGTRLAVIEMIKSGTTFAHDMYFHAPEAWRAFADGGIRAAIGLALFDFNDPARRSATIAETERLLTELPIGAGASGGPGGALVFATIAPHSIYTCSAELLQWAAERAVELQLVYQTHMSETQQEVADCLAAHGMRPFEYLARLGVTERVGAAGIAAHAIWLSEHEHRLVADAGWTVSYNPASNMKLASGCFPYPAFAAHGTPIMLGPDGVASNNSLDMFAEMRLAALLQKHHYADPSVLTAPEALAIAVGARSDIFARWGVRGALAVGEPADLILLDATHPQLTPMHNVVSNLVYAANGTMVDTVFCDGRALMEGRRIPGEEEVRRNAQRCAAALVRRAASA